MTAKQRTDSNRAGMTTRRLIGFLLALCLAGGIVAGCGAVSSTPDVTQVDMSSSTVLLDKQGAEVYRLNAGENRTLIKLKDIPPYVQNAFVAIEDPDFRDHHGINLRGLARAVFRSGLYFLHLPGGRLEGGSTITQQLARQVVVKSQEVSIKRKVQEALTAIQLERHYTKDEILEMYLNGIYFGRGAYGIDAAAKTFFAKDVKDLDVAEAAQLAGMINGPSYFDPYEHPKDSLDRRDLVLQAMLKDAVIDQKQFDAAKAEKPKLGSSKQTIAGQQASWFADYAITLLQDPNKKIPGTNMTVADKYGLTLDDPDSVAKAGLKVYTTLDANLQKLAEQAVADQMNKADSEYGLAGKNPRPEAALIAIDPKTGNVLAMVGGRQHEGLLEFNRATDALRQPGSAIKPLVSYIPALNAGLGPATILDDAPVMLTTDGKTVWPQNYDFRYEGLKPLRFGVEQSINPMAIRAMQAAGGPAKGADFARKLGLNSIQKSDEKNLALALGGISEGVTMLDMTQAYSTIANMGTRVEPVVITKIVDRDGQVLFEAHPRKQQVVRPSVAYLMIDIMKGVIQRGTAYGFTGGFHGWPAAGKTGTTEDNRDAWFIGFTPDLVVSVWNGYDSPSNHLKWTGAFVPVKIWNQFMNSAVTKRPVDWGRPSDVVSATVCRQTGQLPNELCAKDQIGSELFLAGTEPKTAGNLLVKAQVVQAVVQSADKKTTSTKWVLWQPGCGGTPVERVFIKRPQPRVLHPTDPTNPKYVPEDAKDEVPTLTCQPVSIWDRWFGPGQTPVVPGPGQVPGQVPGETPGQVPGQAPGYRQPGDQVPGYQQPGTQQPGAQQPGTMPVPPTTFSQPDPSQDGAGEIGGTLSGASGF